jgi:molecular chaperone GrpE
MPPSPRELAAQKIQFQKEQERLFQDLLAVVDALDHACEHWQQAEQNHLKTLTAADVRPVPKRRGFFGWLYGWWQRSAKFLGLGRGNPSGRSGANPEVIALKASMGEVFTSGREGTEMIRRSLLEVLEQRQVTPLEALGLPFDPQQMYALGRQDSGSAPENTVVQEVVRGYLWRDRVLREAQVIVASRPKETF